MISSRKSLRFVAVIAGVVLGFAASVARAGPYDTAVLLDNPIGYWRFEEANTGMPAADSGSSGTNGTYFDITLQANSANPATLGQSARWVGGNRRIEFASNGVGALGQLTNVDAGGTPPPGEPDSNRKTSVEFWIKTTQTGHNDNWRSPTIFGDESGGDGDNQWGYIRPDGRIAAIAVNDGNHRHHTSVNPLNNDAFHHIVATYDWATRTSQLYVDGAFESNFTGGTNIYQDLDGQVRDMGYNRGQGARFLGEYDEVAIYDYILPAGRVAAHFAAAGYTPPPPPPPPPWTILGTGSGALVGNDLTDVDNIHNEGAYNPPGDFAGFDATFTSSDEPGFGGGEFSFNVFDNGVGGGGNKWCCNDPGGDGHQLDAEFAAPIRLTSFTITSSNDSPGRDPSIWEIQGSNDGINFDTIYAHDNSTDGMIWDARNQVALFEAGTAYSLPAAYKFIRYDVTDTVSSAHALNELEYFDSGDYGVVIPEPATLAVWSLLGLCLAGASVWRRRRNGALEMPDAGPARPAWREENRVAIRQMLDEHLAK